MWCASGTGCSLCLIEKHRETSCKLKGRLNSCTGAPFVKLVYPWDYWPTSPSAAFVPLPLIRLFLSLNWKSRESDWADLCPLPQRLAMMFLIPPSLKNVKAPMVIDVRCNLLLSGILNDHRLIRTTFKPVFMKMVRIEEKKWRHKLKNSEHSERTWHLTCHSQPIYYKNQRERPMRLVFVLQE